MRGWRGVYAGEREAGGRERKRKGVGGLAKLCLRNDVGAQIICNL